MLARRGRIRSPALATTDAIEYLVCGRTGSSLTISMPRSGCGSAGLVATIEKLMIEIALVGQTFMHLWHKVQVE